MAGIFNSHDFFFTLTCIGYAGTFVRVVHWLTRIFLVDIKRLLRNISTRSLISPLIKILHTQESVFSENLCLWRCLRSFPNYVILKPKQTFLKAINVKKKAGSRSSLKLCFQDDGIKPGSPGLRAGVCTSYIFSFLRYK